MNIIKPVNLSLVSITGATDPEPVWAAGTTYATGAVVQHNGAIYVSSIDANTGLNPSDEIQEIEGARWIYSRPINTVSFMDGSINAATVGTSPMVIDVAVDDVFTAMALVKLDCAECHIDVITGPTTTRVATLGTGAMPTDNYLDWVNMRFNPGGLVRIVDDIGGYATSTIRLTITGTAPSIGELLVGRSIPIGRTLLGKTRSRRKSFSTVKTNDFGHTTVKKRMTSRDVTYGIHAPREGFDAIAATLDDLDAVRVAAYAVKDGWPAFATVGYLGDYDLPADYPDHLHFTLTVQGVT